MKIYLLLTKVSNSSGNESGYPSYNVTWVIKISKDISGNWDVIAKNGKSVGIVVIFENIGSDFSAGKQV